MLKRCDSGGEIGRDWVEGRGYEISLGKDMSKYIESRDIQKCPFRGQ